MSKIYKSFDEWAKDYYAYQYHSYISNTDLEKAFDACNPEIEQLKQQRDAFQEAAMQWMRDYYKLKSKYEPEILMEQMTREESNENQMHKKHRI